MKGNDFFTAFFFMGREHITQENHGREWFFMGREGKVS
jgi:hypothetical protein